MAKDSKEQTKKNDKPKANDRVEFKYGVSNLVADTGLQEASVRVALRDSGFTKGEGNRWGWNSDKEYREVLTYFKERNSRKPDTAAKSDDKKTDKAKAGAKAKTTKKAA